MQEVAQPDAYRKEDEQWDVLDILQRDDTLPDATQRRFHLIIYRELVQQKVQQYQHGHATDGYYQITCPRETIEDVVQVGTRLMEERAESTHLQQDDDRCDAHHQ